MTWVIINAAACALHVIVWMTWGSAWNAGGAIFSGLVTLYFIMLEAQ